MQVKIFWSHSRRELEKEVNAWLAQNPCQVVQAQFSSAVADVGEEYRMELTLVLFFVPMMAV